MWVLPLEGDRKPTALLGTQFNEGDPIFSPDGRWMAYVSNESGRNEVYVRPFVASGPVARRRQMAGIQGWSCDDRSPAGATTVRKSSSWLRQRDHVGGCERQRPRVSDGDPQTIVHGPARNKDGM